MRKEGENIIKPPPGKAAIRSTKIMISLLMSKVNVPAMAIPTWELMVDETRWDEKTITPTIANRWC